MRNRLTEKFECVICKTIFDRRTKHMSAPLPEGVRSVNCVTCCKKCANARHGRTSIVHFVRDERYICNNGCLTLPSKTTTDKSKVTCKNCLRKLK